MRPNTAGLILEGLRPQERLKTNRHTLVAHPPYGGHR